MSYNRSSPHSWAIVTIIALLLLVGDAVASLHSAKGRKGPITAKSGKKDSARQHQAQKCKKSNGKGGKGGKGKKCQSGTSAPVVSPDDGSLAPPQTSVSPSSSPSASPNVSPSFSPSLEPSPAPSPSPSFSSSSSPTLEPTEQPSLPPSMSPSSSPSLEPSPAPSPLPSFSPSSSPTREPTEQPSLPPSMSPSSSPTLQPSSRPTVQPIGIPTPSPGPPLSSSPTYSPTLASPPPSLSPTMPPVKPSSPPPSAPSVTPIPLPPPSPPTPEPMLSPSSLSSSSPPTPNPSGSPTGTPSMPMVTSFPQPTPPTPPPSRTPTRSSPQPTMAPSTPPLPGPTPWPTPRPSPSPSHKPSTPMDPSSPPPTLPPSLYPDPPSGPTPTAAPTAVQSGAGSPSAHPMLSQIPSTTPSVLPSTMPMPVTPSLQPSQSPSGSPSVSLAPTVAIFVTEQIGNTKVSTCIKDPADSVMISSRRLSFQYAMLLSAGANVTKSVNDIQDGLHAELAAEFLTCSFARRLYETRMLKDGTDEVSYISISSSPVDTVSSSPLPPESCPLSESFERSDCFLVDAGFTVAYLGEPLPDTNLTATFEPFLSEQMMEGGTLEMSNVDIVSLEFLRFTNLDPQTDNGIPSGITETNISNQNGDNGVRVVAPALIAGAVVGIVLVGFVAIRKRESIYHYFRHNGEEESIDETNDQELSLEPSPGETVARDLLVDTQDNSSDGGSIQWSFAVSENAKYDCSRDEVEVEYRRRPEVPTAEAMLLTEEELDDIIKGLSTASSVRSDDARRYEISDTVVL